MDVCFTLQIVIIACPTPMIACKSQCHCHHLLALVLHHTRHLLKNSCNSRRNKSTLKVITVNFQSIRSKKEVFWDLPDSSKPDVIIGCETWLKPDVANGVIIPPGYETYRHDQPDGYGGVLISIRSDLISHEVSNNFKSELVAAKIKLANDKSLILCSGYRPTNNDLQYAELLCDEITAAVRSDSSATSSWCEMVWSLCYWTSLPQSNQHLVPWYDGNCGYSSNSQLSNSRGQHIGFIPHQ